MVIAHVYLETCRICESFHWSIRPIYTVVSVPFDLLNLVHIKTSGGINFNEFPEKLLTKFRSF